MVPLTSDPGDQLSVDGPPASAASRVLQAQIASLRHVKQCQAHLLHFASIGDLRRSEKVVPVDNNISKRVLGEVCVLKLKLKHLMKSAINYIMV